MSKRISLLIPGLLVAGLAGLLLGGCAGPGATKPPATANDVADFARITTQSRLAMDQALAALDQLSQRGTNLPPSVINAYGQEVADLEVGSVEVRARANAILRRGDAYFDTWERHLMQMKDPDLRQLAEARHPAMLESFHRIESLAAHTTDAFHPFLAGMRQVRDGLDGAPDTMATAQTQALIASTEAEGRRVEQDLDALQQELTALTAMVDSIKPAANK